MNVDKYYGALSNRIQPNMFFLRLILTFLNHIKQASVSSERAVVGLNVCRTLVYFSNKQYFLPCNPAVEIFQLSFLLTTTNN